MKINTPGYVSQSGRIATTETTLREPNPLVRLLGQLIKADVLQTTATTGDDGATPPSGTSTATPSASFVSTLQIGQSRINITTEQPLVPGSSILLKVLSPTSVQLTDPATQGLLPTATPTPPDPTTAMLNAVLRQALPLQKPVTDVLALLTRLLPLVQASPLPGTHTQPPTVMPQATSTDPLVPPRPSAELIAQLKPLLTALVRAPLTPETVVQPQVLRAAIAATGLFRESNLLAWARQLLAQGAGASTAQSPSTPGNVMPGAPAIADAGARPGSFPPPGLDAALQKNLAMATTAPGNRNIDTTTAIAASSIAGNTTSDATQPTDDEALRAQILQAIAARTAKGATSPAVSAGAVSAGVVTTATATATAASTAQTSAVDELARTASLAGGTATTTTGPTPRATTNTSAPLAPLVTDDTKTALERLVVMAARQLIARSANEQRDATNDLGEEQILALLRSLPLQPQLQATTPQRNVQDDSEWLLLLLRGSFGALKHLQLQQASNLGVTPDQSGQPDSPAAPLQIELPVFVAQQWHRVNIDIERRNEGQKSANETTQRAWRVTLRFELPEQGIIVAQLNLAGNDVTATLWAEQKRTCDTLRQQLDVLSKRLQDAGATVATIDVRHGQPTASKTRVEKRLIDIRT